MAYTNIDDPSAFFQTAIYTGNGDSSDDTNAITNDGNSDLKPDFLWIKRRDYDNGHQLADSTRGVTKFLGSETTAAEVTLSGRLASFDTDGFTVQSSSGAFNAENEPFVAWQWKCNVGTTATNTTGTIDSVVQANTTAGFSIVTFTSPASGVFSVGHGLGVQPAMVITKSLVGTSNWWTWHKGLTGGNSNSTYIVALERISTEASYANAWGSTGVTSSVFGMQAGNTAVASKNYLAYCFAEKQGYSKFGRYVGNGNANGPFVYTGFKPAWVVVKRIDATTNADWICTDNKRGINGANPRLYLDLADAEGSAATYVDLVSNGFKLKTSSGSMNTSGGTYIYMAFAENPFTTSTGIPTTAR